MRKAIYTGSKFEEIAGYSRAVIDDPWVFVSGTVGVDPATGTYPETAVDQATFALQTIGAALAEGRASFADVVQVRVYLVSRDDVLPVSKLLGQTFTDPRPTNTTILCNFAVDAIKVEIEVVALRRDRSAGPVGN